jgi:hypothetical protein
MARLQATALAARSVLEAASTTACSAASAADLQTRKPSKRENRRTSKNKITLTCCLLTDIAISISTDLPRDQARPGRKRLLSLGSFFARSIVAVKTKPGAPVALAAA